VDHADLVCAPKAEGAAGGTMAAIDLLRVLAT
jgi:hypothetical protein